MSQYTDRKRKHIPIQFWVTPEEHAALNDLARFWQLSRKATLVRAVAAARAGACLSPIELDEEPIRFDELRLHGVKLIVDKKVQQPKSNKC